MKKSLLVLVLAGVIVLAVWFRQSENKEPEIAVPLPEEIQVITPETPNIIPQPEVVPPLERS